MDAYAKSQTPTEDRDKRQTPLDVVCRLQELIKIPFVHDVCAEYHTAKCVSFWTKEDNAFLKDWLEPLTGFSLPAALWMNPPFSDVGPWLRRAHETAMRGGIVVALIPDDRSVQWYQEFVENKAQIVYVPNRRISFEDKGGNPQRGNPKGTVFALYLPMAFDKTSYVRFEL